MRTWTNPASGKRSAAPDPDILCEVKPKKSLVERQAERIIELEKALYPFAQIATVGDQRPKDDAVWAGQDGKRITFGDFRLALRVLNTP